VTGFPIAEGLEQQIDWIRGRDAFTDIETDDLITGLLAEALNGTLGVEFTSGRFETPKLRFSSDHNDEEIESRFALEAQLRNGAQLPSTRQRSRVGLLNLPRYLLEVPRVAFAAALTSPGEYLLNDAYAVACWSVLIPGLAVLMRPFRLCGDLLQELHTWDTSVHALETLGFDVSPLAAIAPKSGYFLASSEEQIARRGDALAGLTQRVPPDLGARYRAMALSRVATKYYSTLRRDGTNTRKRVLTAPLAPDVTAGCLGDWEQFLEILGEPLPADERIRREPICVEADLDLRAEGPVASINARIDVLERVWDEIDALQAAENLSHKRGVRVLRWTADAELLPRLQVATRDDVRALWGTETATRSIDRIVSCRSPTARMLEGLAPAIGIWDDLLDDAWRVANGYYRLSGSESIDRFEPALAELAAVATPVSRDVIQALLERIQSVHMGIPADDGVSISVSISEAGEVTVGSPERDESPHAAAFIQLRDLVTDARREWADSFLTSFLSERWRAQFTAAAVDYGRRLVERNGKPPTVKQSAPINLINLWFAGEVEPYYQLIGHERVHTQLRSVASVDLEAIVEAAMKALGIAAERPSTLADDESLRWSDTEEDRRHLYLVPHDIRKRVLDVWRALELGEDPDAASVSPGNENEMRSIATALDTTPERAWRALTDVVLELIPAPTSSTVL